MAWSCAAASFNWAVVAWAAAAASFTEAALTATSSAIPATTGTPGVTFAIGRIDDQAEEVVGDVKESSELLAAAPSDVVVALDGATIDAATAQAYVEAAIPAAPGAMGPSTVQREAPTEPEG